MPGVAGQSAVHRASIEKGGGGWIPPETSATVQRCDATGVWEGARVGVSGRPDRRDLSPKNGVKGGIIGR